MGWLKWFSYGLISSFVGLSWLILLSPIVPDSTFSSLLLSGIRHKEDGNLAKVVTSFGYPFEEHTVQTKDGYILSLHRIPHGKNSQKKSKNGPKDVVLMVHGLFGASDNYLINPPDQSLGYIVADAEYDAWFLNCRGNGYSNKHSTYQLSDKKFWDYSFDDIAKYDLPAAIDYILKTTKQKDLYYVGTSQGGASSLALLSEQPEYNKKIKLNFALSPAAYVGNMFGVPRIAFLLASHVVRFLGNRGIFASNFSKQVTRTLYSNNEYFLKAGLRGFGGSQLIDKSNIDFLLSFFPSSSSLRAMAHFGQNIRSQAFLKYDFGEKRNLLEYGQVTPPEYKVSSITTPTVLMISKGDELVTPSDAALLKMKLGGVAQSYQVPDENFSHIDFNVAPQAKDLVNKEIIRLIKKDRKPAKPKL